MLKVEEYISQSKLKLLDETDGCLLLYIRQPISLDEMKRLDSLLTNSPEGGAVNE